ncbi:MFS transporter [Pseudomonas putida]|uniref:MFS transporter n=1 Tax=Pseudomonas putida TaxID=303 RepID=UPI0002C49290|nr:MFS transporter [Pseudomonas putida]EMR47545.1 major facilitator superfamily protein [Pseudomonas putida LS46]
MTPDAKHQKEDNEALHKIYKSLNLRILIPLMICYLFANLDRQNISFAKLQMQSHLGFSDAVYGLGAGIFFIGYVLFEIPSNLILLRRGARETFSRILILWGLASTSMMLVENVKMFYGIRFLLGVFEAGFAPGMILYLTYWYSEARMARALSIVLIAGPASGVIAGPLSFWLISVCDGLLGLAGWQWMFVIEGLPCVVLGLTIWLILPDKPADATWLSDAEKEKLKSQLPTQKSTRSSLIIFTSPKAYLLGIAYFCLICGIYTLKFWLPSILKQSGMSNTLELGYASALPYLAGVLGMLLFGWSSDRHLERRWHSILPALAAGALLSIATMVVNSALLFLTFISLTAFCLYGSYGVFWAAACKHLKKGGEAGGIALINSIGLIGGFISPSLIGWSSTATGSLDVGMHMMACLLISGGILLFAISASKYQIN